MKPQPTATLCTPPTTTGLTTQVAPCFQPDLTFWSSSACPSVCCYSLTPLQFTLGILAHYDLIVSRECAQPSTLVSTGQYRTVDVAVSSGIAAL